MLSPRWLPRIIFGLALLGVFLVTDMYLQETFGRGCFSPEAANSLTCDDVFESSAGSFFGISNVIMGLLFYLLLAGMRYAYVAIKPPTRETIRKASFGLVTIGLVYSAYLTYFQYFSSELADVAPCKLCLASALTTAVLFILHLLEHRKVSPKTPPRNAFALKPLTIMAGIAAVIILADVAYAKGLFGGKDATPTGTVTEETGTLGAEEQVDPASLIVISNPELQCTYDPAYETLSGLEPFLDGPYIGNADAPVRVVKVFDPNCPHCKDLHAAIEPVAEANTDKARFYFVPYPLWEHSFGQVQALRIAASQGKFSQMLELMFARQQPAGLTLDQIVEIASEVGMDGPAFRERIQDQD